MYWGERLLLLSIQHGSQGFRGAAKGKGFQAYLKSEGIPKRKAYRLIRRYKIFRAMYSGAGQSNAELLEEVLGPPPSPEQLTKLENACNELVTTMSDADRVTNAGNKV